MNEFSLRKKKWWNGFRDASTKQVLEYDISVGQFGIPRGLSRYNINDIDPQNEKQLKVMNYMWDMINDEHAHRTMVVSGGNGTGKTFIGCAFIHGVALLESINDCRFHEPRYTNEGLLLRSLGGFNSDSAFRFWTEGCGVLVLDELGMTQWTPSDKRTIEQVLNIRFSNDLPTVILTNRKPAELFGSQGDPNAALFSSQLRSRFKNGYLVEFTGPDLRGQTIVEEEDSDYDDPF